MAAPIGIYIHVPFCLTKCPYCNFYSLTTFDQALLDAYTAAVLKRLDGLDTPADTLYFGGGTPSLLGGRRLAAIIQKAGRKGLCSNAEITLEANPAEDLLPVFRDFAAAGGNRLSLGMQSANPSELTALGRRHGFEQLERAVEAAHAAGIANLSLDIMLGIPGQTAGTVEQSIEQAFAFGAKHISVYLLKIEPGTPFYSQRERLSIPDEDTAADLYFTAGEALDRRGYRQYEISNFACPGYESRHNLKYWNCEPYIGLGPAAHSFVSGRRLAYPGDLGYFLQGGAPVEEREGGIPAGSPEEYAMLRLRLTEGLTETAYRQRFGAPIPAEWRQRAASLPAGYIIADEVGIRLTRSGFLLSNAILGHLLADA